MMDKQRVIELAQEAGLEYNFDPMLWLKYEDPMLWLKYEEFAELIVRECVSVAMEQYDDAEPWGGVQEVLKHFGVKE